MKIKHVVILVVAASLSGCQYLPTQEKDPAPAPAPAMAKPKVKTSTIAPAPAAKPYDPWEDREGDGQDDSGSWN